MTHRYQPCTGPGSYFPDPFGMRSLGSHGCRLLGEERFNPSPRASLQAQDILYSIYLITYSICMRAIYTLHISISFFRATYSKLPYTPYSVRHLGVRANPTGD
ncbi:hypothetical protein CPSG_01792 [Coccidioides posadasii str. Silveira]|uniref:Uncharacterized protein n=1 Tax=Coccidioides posadasii (strain RMSCC 757 / Silveira) TaxID=443226 RepID=E9CWF9_COCPS|nr:hypothetical protein CPSG_01792 [Coccidioides posadasii str. Silveira]